MKAEHKFPNKRFDAHPHPILNFENKGEVAGDIDVDYHKVEDNPLRFRMRPNVVNTELQSMIKSGKAEYKVSVECTSTWLIDEQLLNDDLEFELKSPIKGPFNIHATIALTKDIPNYSNTFKTLPPNTRFNLKSGSTLAVFPDVSFSKRQSQGLITLTKSTDPSNPLSIRVESESITIAIQPERYDEYQEAIDSKTSAGRAIGSLLGHAAITQFLMEPVGEKAPLRILMDQAMKQRKIKADLPITDYADALSIAVKLVPLPSISTELDEQ